MRKRKSPILILRCGEQFCGLADIFGNPMMLKKHNLLEITALGPVIPPYDLSIYERIIVIGHHDNNPESGCGPRASARHTDIIRAPVNQWIRKYIGADYCDIYRVALWISWSVPNAEVVVLEQNHFTQSLFYEQNVVLISGQFVNNDTPDWVEKILKLNRQVSMQVNFNIQRIKFEFGLPSCTDLFLNATRYPPETFLVLQKKLYWMNQNFPHQDISVDPAYKDFWIPQVLYLLQDGCRMLNLHILAHDQLTALEIREILCDGILTQYKQKVRNIDMFIAKPPY